MTTFEQEFAAVVRDAREARGLTQAQFADEMTARGIEGWRQQTVTRVENGHRRFWIGEALAAAAILGISVADLSVTPPPCATCDGRPLAGFTCDSCGKSGTPSARHVGDVDHDPPGAVLHPGRR